VSISYDLISQFAKQVTGSTKKTSDGSTVYGTIVVDEHGDKYVKLDGSDLLTPVTNTSAVANADERVSVLIKNHTATVTGNISSPAARTDDVEDLGTQVSKIQEFDILIGKQVQANEAYFKKLLADEATLGKLVAAEANIVELLAKSAEIDEMLAGEITVTDLIAAKIDADVVIADKAIIESLSASNIDVLGLIADKAVINKLIAEDADLNSVEAKNAYLKFATVDLANIGEAAIEKLFGQTGIITDLTINEGRVAGTLAAVRILGDSIEGGTIKADKLVVKGPNGLYYALNVTENGDTTVTEKYTPEELQNGLLGSIIVAKSITAEKIAVDDLVAFGAYLAGFNVKDLEDDEGSYLTSAIYSGVKQSVHNPTTGLYMDKDGQFAVGNSSEYIKFYRSEDGQFHLDMAARNITLSTGKTVEEAIDETMHFQIGARNLIRNSKTLKFVGHHFEGNPNYTKDTSVLAEATLGDMILGEE
jgi:hypothetical protein